MSGLEQKKIKEDVWLAIEKKMDIDKEILKEYWYLQLHMQFFHGRALSLNDLKIDLILQ